MRSARKLALPTGVYLTVTVVVPAVNGGVSRPDFWVHALWVFVVCAGVIAVIVGMGRACRRAWSAR